MANELYSSGFPSLDLLLNGGFRKGYTYQAFGPTSSGRSLFFNKVIGNTQKDGLAVGLVDCCNTYDVKCAKKLLDPNHLIYIRPTTLMAAFVNIEACVQHLDLLVIDQIECLTNGSDMAESDRRVEFINQNLPHLNDKIERSECAVIFISTTMKAPSGIDVAGGGRGLAYYSFVRLMFGSDDIIHSRSGLRIGRHFTITSVKNAFGANLNGMVYFDIVNGEVTDQGYSERGNLGEVSTTS